MSDSPKGNVCHMDKMPAEVRQKIFGYAVVLEKDITPFQVKRRSNKFFWDKAQIGYKGISAVPQLTAVHLSRCNKTIYGEVATTHLFYRVNHFDFTNVEEFAKFMAAITPNRAMSIHSLSTVYVNTRYSIRKSMLNIHFAALRACHGLEHLEIVFHGGLYEIYYHHDITIDNAHPDLLVVVQGLKSLNIKVADYNPLTMGTKNVYDDIVARSKTCRERLESVIRQAMMVEKAQVYRPSKYFSSLTEWAALDIDGDGRLGEDRKPGVVASRTRQSTKNLAKLDAYGVIPKEVSPKYNLNGDLIWDIDTIADARASDDVLYPVDFLCNLRYRDAEDRFTWVIPQESKTWENLAVFCSGAHLMAIVTFYKWNLEAYGKELVVDVWKAGGHQYAEGRRPGDVFMDCWENEEDGRKKTTAVEELEKLIVTQAAMKAAEDAEKAKQAKKAKKAKAKEARKAKKAAKAKGKGKGKGR